MCTEATLAVALSNTQAELESTIRSSITNTPRLPHSIQFRAGGNIPQRYFSSTASSSVRSLPRVSGSRTTPGRSTVVRSSRCRQQSNSPGRSKFGHWMPSPAKPFYGPTSAHRANHNDHQSNTPEPELPKANTPSNFTSLADTGLLGKRVPDEIRVGPYCCCNSRYCRPQSCWYGGMPRGYPELPNVYPILRLSLRIV